MFKPIRNLITYIQKNASGSTFFGGTPSNTELSDTAITMECEMNETNESVEPTAETSTSTEPTSLVDEKNLQENNNDTEEKLVLRESIPFVSTNPVPVQQKRIDVRDNLLAEEEEEEEEKDIFLDFPPENENDVNFPVSEVIVMNDPDLNVSTNSDPSLDPLAIDDYNSHIESNPLESSTEGEVLFVVDIEEVVSQAPRLVDEVEDSTQLTAVKSADEQELRSDGSDSGLGSETSTLTSVTDTSVSSAMCASPIMEKTTPLRSNLKRHIEDVVDGGSRQLQKKPRRSINFESVKVFYFPRIQGHMCVPSQGGCTLGMGAHHISFKTFSLAEHAAEIRRAHKLQLQEINPRSSSSDESDSDEELSEGSGSDLDADTNGFLQPVSPKQRRALLKAAGIRKIDASEKIECRDIRNSREVCGCVCRDFCDPDTCACSQAGIKCQVDRAMFPCGCSRDACGNVIGRIEFNPARVRTHFIHTIMRLDMENRQQKRTDELSSQMLPSPSHLVYNNVPALANSSTTAISTYNQQMPSYGLDQSPNEVYHHHMHQQQYNMYNNHMPPTNPASGLCAQLSPPSMVLNGPPTAALPPPHNIYANCSSTEPDSTALNGGNLHYQDSPIYPPIMPPVETYGDILAPYANTTPYENTQPAVNNSYPSSPNVYTNYHNPHHHNNHVQSQQPFLGYTNTCSGEMSEFSEPQNNFISLNTPEASSSRLSAINDLLHNNRNTTAALVAVSSIETSLIRCEAEPQEQVANHLPVSDVKEPIAKTIETSEPPGICARPDTPPDDEPATESVETNIFLKELPKTDEQFEIATESPSEVAENTKQIDNPQVEKSEPPPIEVLQNDVFACKTNIITDNISINGSSDLQADLLTKADENGINNNSQIPPIVESVSA